MNEEVVARSPRTFLVSIHVNMPYPKVFDFRQQASSFSPAVSRAIREFRKQVKGKKIKDMTIKVVSV